MLKRTRFAAVMAIVLAIVVANTADARPGGSFRGGFSSSKPSAARSIGSQRQPAFGSFGKRQSPPPAAARTPRRESAMSRDLERKAAQEQALRTYDARRAASAAGRSGPSAAPGMAGAATAGGALPPLNPVLPGGGNGGGSGRNGGQAQGSVPGGGATSAAAPVIVRDSSNGWLWGIGGFMLGRATGGHAAPPPAAQPVPQPGPSSSVGAMADAAGASDISTAAAEGAEAARATPLPAAKPAASEAGIIARLAVLLLFCGMAWLVWKAFRLMAGAQAVKKHANYSFERN